MADAPISNAAPVVIQQSPQGNNPVKRPMRRDKADLLSCRSMRKMSSFAIMS